MASTDDSAVPDLHLFSDENVLKQMELAPEHLGYKILRFYVDQNGIISKQRTDTIDTFYLAPSGGTLRDKNLNIVHYSAKFDLYKGLGRSR